MNARNYSLIFTTMLLANVTTTAIAGVIIYGMLSGVVPGRQMSLQAGAPAAAPPARIQRLYNASAAEIPIAGSPGPGEVMLLCRRMQESAHGGPALETDDAAGDSLLPLVDRRSGSPRAQGTEFFF